MAAPGTQQQASCPSAGACAFPSRRVREKALAAAHTGAAGCRIALTSSLPTGCWSSVASWPLAGSWPSAES
eukprot:6183252-Pleurochrysis_carterae.AAC.1